MSLQIERVFRAMAAVPSAYPIVSVLRFDGLVFPRPRDEFLMPIYTPVGRLSVLALSIRAALGVWF